MLVSPGGRDDKKHKYHILLCDFGLCAKMAEDSWNLTDFVGSPGFFAPEVCCTMHSIETFSSQNSRAEDAR